MSTEKNISQEIITHIQSIVGVGSTDLGLLSVGRGRRSATPVHQVTWSGATYLVGAGVSDYARPIERMDFMRLADTPELRALAYATLGNLLPDGGNVAIMVGLPVEVMLDTDLAKATRRTLRNWLQDTHTFTLDGKAISVQVEKVNVMAQPAGAYAYYALDNAGRVTLSAQEKRGTVAICDIGFNTLDLLTVRGGNEIIPAKTGGDTLGMRRAAELLSDVLQRQYGVKLSRHQADEVLRAAHPEIETQNGFIDVSTTVQQARQVAASGIIDFVTSRWGQARNISKVIFTGGGAEALKSELLALYPQAQVLTDAVTANATGLARFAVNAFRSAYAPSVIGLDPGFGGFKATRLWRA